MCTWPSGNQLWEMFINSCVSWAISRIQMELQADDVHPINVTDRFKVTVHISALMAMCLSKFLKRPTNRRKVIIKEKWLNRGGGYGLEVPCEYLFEGDSFACRGLLVGLRKDEFDVGCSRPKQNHSLLILVFMYIMLCVMSCRKKPDMVHILLSKKILKSFIVIDYETA